MQTIIEKLHSQFADMPDLRMREIRVDKQVRKVFCTLSYPDMPALAREKKDVIASYVRSAVPKGYVCAVSLVNDNFTPLTFRRLLFDLLKRRYPIYGSINKEKIEIALDGKRIDVKFTVNSVVKTSMEVADFVGQLDEFFANYTSYRVEIAVVVDESEVININMAEQEKLVQLAINRELLKPSRYLSVQNVEKHIGKVIGNAPMYIADIRKSSDSCVICGKVSQKTLQVSKSNPNMHVCKFTLSDDSGGSIPCVLFAKFQIEDFKTIKETTGKTDNEALTISRTKKIANEKKLRKLMDIYDGMEVIVRGRVAQNSFSERLEMCVYDLCKCKIVPKSNANFVSRTVADSYLLVKPEEYQEFRQITFVGQISEHSILTGKKYVVLHANMTGANVIKDKIFAICAVKVEDGHVTEKLFTYVNPEVAVDEQALQNAFTSAEKLLFYPTITEIVSDLYKFTYGFTLVGTNVRTILELINYYATPVGYLFTNKDADQTELLNALFDASILSRKPNIGKLEDVAKACKTACPSATFCGDTALTVAKCFAFLAEKAK